MTRCPQPPDSRGILTWHSDIRESLPVGSATDIAARHDELAAVMSAWPGFAP